MKRRPRTPKRKPAVVEASIDPPEAEPHGMALGDLGPEIDEPDSEFEFFSSQYDAPEGLAEERGESL